MSAQPSDTISVGIRSIIAGNVLSLMGRNRISQARLAKELGMSQSSLSKRLSCLVDWGSDDLAAIADFFGRDVSDLLTISCKSEDAGQAPVLELINGQGRSNVRSLPFLQSAPELP